MALTTWKTNLFWVYSTNLSRLWEFRAFQTSLLVKAVVTETIFYFISGSTTFSVRQEDWKWRFPIKSQIRRHAKNFRVQHGIQIRWKCNCTSSAWKWMFGRKILCFRERQEKYEVFKEYVSVKCYSDLSFFLFEKGQTKKWKNGKMLQRSGQLCRLLCFFTWTVKLNRNAHNLYCWVGIKTWSPWKKKKFSNCFSL